MRPPLLHRAALTDPTASAFERLFAGNGWSNSWRNGVFDWHHFHTNTHEVLGCHAGSATIRFGGSAGEDHHLSAGDVVVIPAGLAHCLIEASPDFAVVGAYPAGAVPDMHRGDGRALDMARPAADPVLGPGRGFAAPG